MSHAPRLVSHAPRLVSHALRLVSHASRLVSHALRLVSHASRLVSHTLRLVSHAPRLVSHASRLASHALRLASRASACGPDRGAGFAANFAWRLLPPFPFFPLMTGAQQTPRPRRAGVRLTGLRLGLLASSLALALGVAEIALGARRSAAPRRGEGPQVTRHDPLLGWSLVPSAQGRHRTAEYDVAVRISSQGWRADRSYSPVPGPGTRRIVAVGDSFTFGQGVEAEETFASRLERLLPSTEVINLGVSGYGTDQQLLLLQHRGLALRPDTVVLGLLVTNVFRNDDEAHGRYAKPVFRLGPEGRLALANVPVPAPVPAPVPRPGPASGSALAAPPRPGGLLARSRLANFVRTRLEYGGHGPAWPLTAAILGEAARLCHGAGADLVVLVIPTQDAVQGSPADRRRQAAMVRRVAALVPRGEAEVVDPTPVLVARFDAEPAVPLFYEQDGHLTATGHRVLAEVLARRLAPPGGDIGCMDAGSLAADEET